MCHPKQTHRSPCQENAAQQISEPKRRFTLSMFQSLDTCIRSLEIIIHLIPYVKIILLFTL